VPGRRPRVHPVWCTPAEQRESTGLSFCRHTMAEASFRPQPSRDEGLPSLLTLRLHRARTLGLYQVWTAILFVKEKSAKGNLYASGAYRAWYRRHSRSCSCALWCIFNCAPSPAEFRIHEDLRNSDACCFTYNSSRHKACHTLQ
jgi:hypothetical protein